MSDRSDSSALSAAPGAAPAVAGTRIAIGSLRFGHDVMSLCPECLRSIPGKVLSTPTGMVMRKTCPEHGA